MFDGRIVSATSFKCSVQQLACQQIQVPRHRHRTAGFYSYNLCDRVGNFKLALPEGEKTSRCAHYNRKGFFSKFSFAAHLRSRFYIHVLLTLQSFITSQQNRSYVHSICNETSPRYYSGRKNTFFNRISQSCRRHQNVIVAWLLLKLLRRLVFHG